MPIFEDNEEINDEDFRREQEALNKKVSRLEEKKMWEKVDFEESMQTD